jgi:hypothetical protein
MSFTEEQWEAAINEIGIISNDPIDFAEESSIDLSNVSTEDLSRELLTREPFLGIVNKIQSHEQWVAIEQILNG